MAKKVTFTDEELRKRLSPEQYRITQEKGTEAPFTGAYYYNKEKGMYQCSVCGNDLFSSDTKYESGSGWPSFYAPVSGDRVETAEDKSLGMKRIEIMCGRCGAHLGHVFDDGPKPSGKRFCVNSAALKLKKDSTH